MKKLRELLSTGLEKAKQIILKILALKNKQITPAQLQRIISIVQFIVIAVLFVFGYRTLDAVNGTLAHYLLAANLLFFANYYLFKMK